MSYPTARGLAVEGLAYREAQVCLGVPFANFYYQFSSSGGNTPANVYQNGTLTTPFPITGLVAADSFGRFPPIYLDPSVSYRVRLYSALNVQQWQSDPYNSQLSTVGTSSLSAYGVSIATTGEVTIPAPNTGGTGTSLTLNAGGGVPLKISAPLPGNSALIVNTSATTGAQTATFVAINKPGTSAQPALTVIATAAPSGGAYVGGNLTANFTGPSSNTYTVQLSTGQVVTGATFTNGAVAFVTPSTSVSGSPTATFNVGSGVVSLTATVAPTGATYAGGNLTANFTGPTASTYVIQLSTGQIVTGVTFTNGSAAFTTPMTAISGTPTTALTVGTNSSAPTTPAGWLPVTCDSVQYYTPIWHGNPFTPYAAGPTAIGEVIAASSVTFGGGGLTTVTGGTATPAQWFSPPTANVGTGYYINITKTGGLSALAFSAAQGSWTNITSGGLTITSNAGAPVSGTYRLATSALGTPVVATGTITLSGNNGVQSPTYTGSTSLMLDGDGTALLNGASAANWYAPTTSNVGAGYYVFINQTGGTPGYSFSAATGAYTNITNSGILVGISGSGASSFYVTGTYTIASDAGGVNQLGSGTVTLSGGSVQSPNWSGTTPLNLAGNGAATLNGVGTSSWLSPNIANSGAGYWINITRTGGTTGVNFTAAQGSWTNITNSGLTIDMSGYTGDVGTATVTGTYQISSSSSGTPVLGSGTVSLSVSGLTLTRTYSTAGTYTDTVPTGASNAEFEAFGPSGNGGAGSGTGCAVRLGGGGGSGGRPKTTIAVTGGQTTTIVVGAVGANTTVTAGTLGITTMTAGHGGNGGNGPGGTAGTAGTASGGSVANTAGNAGDSGGGGDGTGASGVVGDNGTGGAGGNGGEGAANLGHTNGAAGVVVIKYS